MLTKLYAHSHFLKLKGKGNLHRPSEYVPDAFECTEIKIETGVQRYLAVPVYIFKFQIILQVSKVFLRSKRKLGWLSMNLSLIYHSPSLITLIRSENLSVHYTIQYSDIFNGCRRDTNTGNELIIRASPVPKRFYKICKIRYWSHIRGEGVNQRV